MADPAPALSSQPVTEPPAAPSTPASPSWATAAAALVPLALYVWTAGDSAYWLDSPEFTAAAIDLDIPHPPGHPLANLWGKLFCFLPFGPLPFRVALAQAVASAGALAAAQLAIARSLAHVGLARPMARGLIGLGAAWLLAASHGFWFQSVRAEVYALQALCICVALERLSLLACSERPGARPFYQATLALGLGLANHHFMSVLALPSLLYALVSLVRAQGVTRPLAWGLGSGALGLLTYAYLPLRAATEPPMDLGHPISLGALAWVVSARVYARNIGGQAVQPMDERFADLLVILVDNLFAPTLLLMLLGLYLLLRARRTWALGYLWGITALVNLAGRAWLNPVRANPDVLGYMLPGFVAVAALAACALGLVLVRVGQAARLSVGAAGLCALAGAAALMAGAPQSSLAQFHAGDAFDELRRRNLPARAALVLLAPQSVFRHYGGEATERLRPDLRMLPVPFLDYGEKGAVLARAEPELAHVVDQYVRTGGLSVPALLALSRERPVLLELDASLSLPLFPQLVPNGLLHQLLTAPPSRERLREAARERERAYRTLYAALGAQAGELETKRHLLWMHYTDALYYAFHGQIDAARAAAARGLALEPQARELAALEAALAHATGPIDIRPFLIAR